MEDVLKEEGIDELANFCGKGKAIANLTSRAMGGNMTFQESLKQRLEILQPSLSQVEEFLRVKPATFTPGIEELVQILHQNGIPVYLVSGGFRRMIAPVAKCLNIPQSHVYANCLLFSDSGEYVGFDEQKQSKMAVFRDLIRDAARLREVICSGLWHLGSRVSLAQLVDSKPSYGAISRVISSLE